jgi:hypothetical protein
MVEKTPILDTLTYLFLMLGIVVVGFPIIYTIIAATLPIEEVSKVPMPLIPGDQFWVNIQEAWTRGDLGTQLFNSFVMVMNIIYTFFDTFGVIHTVTQWGPGGATNILVYKVYQDGFIGLNLGSSAAQSIVLMTLIISITVVQFKYVERKVQYAG